MLHDQQEEIALVKKKITRKRIEIAEEIATVDKMGDVTKVQMPEDMAAMFAGKVAMIALKGQTAIGNILGAYERTYEIPPDVTIKLEEVQKAYMKLFEGVKKQTSVMIEETELWKRFSGVRGFSPYQLGLIMAYIKDISRFDTPMKLCVYAGVSCVGNLAITKANINKIKEIYTDQGKEFAGFKTEFAGRMLGVVVDCLIRSQGYFYTMYQHMRARLTERCINNNECENIKGKLYMKGKKNQSLIMFTDKNAKRRVARTLLTLIWCEWRLIKGLPVRKYYAIEKMGHTTEITLDMVLKADQRNKN